MGSFPLRYSTVKAWAERLRLPFRASEEAGQIAVRCRTFNVLVSEGRSAVAALLLTPPA